MGPRRGSIHAKLQGLVMTVEVAIQPLAALVAGFLILLAPRLLSYVVAVYLILVGILGLWPNLIT
jgi:hypothetical protein